MEVPRLKADMHVHSKYSTRPSEWVLRKIGCSESYTDPVQIYHRARSLGMDLVTITDHNTLAGSLEIAHLENTFVSEEITTYFPEDGCKLHVLAYGVLDSQHDDILRLRENVFDLVKYLEEKKIVHVLAHPLFAVNDLLTEKHFCQTLLLFRNFELNGSRDECTNMVLQEILTNLREEDIVLLADRYNLEPCCGTTPWIKNLTSGSDDHSSLYLASSFTEVEGASTPGEFLLSIAEKRSTPRWRGCGPQHLAQNLYSIAYQFYKSRFDLERYIGKDLLLRFIDRALLPVSETEEGFIGRIREAISSRKQTQRPEAETRNMKELILREGREIVLADPLLRNVLKNGSEKGAENDFEREKVWFSFVNQVSEKVLRRFADSILVSAAGANVFDIFQSLGSAGSLYTMLAPYFVSYTLFNKDRRFSLRCREVVNQILYPDAPAKDHGPSEEEVRVAHFTDTFHEVNGVALTLRMEAASARKLGKHLTMITCGRGTDSEQVKHFAPVGSFALPEYPELKLYYPPLLEMLDFCHQGDFTYIHSATPGPIGLAALAIARILKIPIYGTYHTALPQYVNILTGDHSLEEMMWRYSIWYYNQMDVVYVPSFSTGRELEEKGVRKERIRFFPRGIDINRFHPSKRNGFFRRRLGLEDGVIKLLYVGRVSREKNLPLLAESFKDLAGIRRGLRLIVVGDGPYLREMQESLKGAPASFTGYLSGEDLAQAYASSDVFVFPSATDTFGNVVLEAQASGLPVVVTDQGGPRENLIDGETGFVVPSSEKGPLKAAILRLVDDPPLRDRMGKRAREYMNKRSFESAFLELWDSYRITPADEPRHG